MVVLPKWLRGLVVIQLYASSNLVHHPMNKQEKEDIVARALQTPEGKKKFRAAFQLSCAIAADKFTEGSVGWILGRMLAGLPPK